MCTCTCTRNFGRRLDSAAWRLVCANADSSVLQERFNAKNLKYKVLDQHKYKCLPLVFSARLGSAHPIVHTTIKKLAKFAVDNGRSDRSNFLYQKIANAQITFLGRTMNSFKYGSNQLRVGFATDAVHCA